MSLVATHLTCRLEQLDHEHAEVIHEITAAVERGTLPSPEAVGRWHRLSELSDAIMGEAGLLDDEDEL